MIIRPTFELPLAAFATMALFVAAPLAATPGSVRDFRLPPAEKPTREPQAQGPIDTEGPVRRAPRVITNDEPAQATATPQASNVQPAPEQRPTTRPLLGAPTRQPAARPPVPVERVAPLPSLPSEEQSSPVELPARDDPTIPSSPRIEPSSATDFATVAVPQASEEVGFPPWWWAGLAALLAAFGLGYVLWRRRRYGVAGAQADDRMSLQRMAPDAATTVTPALTPASASTRANPRVPVQIVAQAHSLSRSLMNATLSFSLDLRNLATAPVRGLSVEADLVTAHGQAPLEEQLANRGSDIQPATIVETIPAQQTHRLDSELRLPVHQLRTIQQGTARLYVPLLRIRLDIDDKEPLIRTFVIGILPPGGRGKLQPFRLDEMAQTYRNIGLRALD